jgi:MFS family permease
MLTRERPFFGNYEGRLFLVLVLGNMLIASGLRLVPPLLPSIIDNFAISSTEAGFALTVMWGLNAVFQSPGGRLADGLTRKSVIAASLGLLAVGLGVVLTSQVYLMFLLGAVVVGVGSALYPPATYSMTADLFSARRGQFFGVLGASINVGGIVAAGLSSVILAVTVWQMAFLPVLLGLVVVLALVHVLCREEYAVGRVSLDPRGTVGRFFRNRQLRWVLVAFVLFAFVWQSIATILPTFLEFEKGLPQWYAQAAFAAIYVVGIVASPVAGHLGDRYGHVTTATAITSLGGVGLVLLIATSDPVVVGAGVLALAGGLIPFWAVMEAYLMNFFPDRSAGGDFGTGRALYLGIGSLGPTYVGAVADALDYTSAFVGLGVCLACCLLIVAFRL